MVAVIKTGHSIPRILNYNEQKVKEGVAECISAANYPIDIQNLSLKFKLNRLLNQAALNENVSRNSVHISLNFDPSEKLSNAQLQEISDTYMQKIGFGKQPYLVYQHFDSGHPHIHIVSIKVRADGSRIDTQNIGRNQSEKARKEIENTFNLVRAEDSTKSQVYELKPVNAQRVQYGRSETKRAITNVLERVLKSYKYSSLAELNAVLRLYNVITDRGSEGSRIFKARGLSYRVLDAAGNKVGVPIKASDFYNKPTLAYIEQQFTHNDAAKQPNKARVKNAIDLTIIRQKKPTLSDLVNALKASGIDTVLRENADGIIYGITYVDHQTKCVSNGSDLGKQYSAKGIQERCNVAGDIPVQKHGIKPDQFHAVPNKLNTIIQAIDRKETNNILESLLQTEHVVDYVPHQLKKKGRKKLKKSIANRL